MPIIIFILLMLFSPLTYAETCVNEYGGDNSCVEGRTYGETAGDCATLGYTATNCNDQAFLKCPFDESKLKCVENAPTPRTCAELGFTETSCEDGVNSMKCPIEESPAKYICGEVKGKSCSEFGFTTSDKSEWCAEIVTCEENGVPYTLCKRARTKKVKPPVIRFGDIEWVKE